MRELFGVASGGIAGGGLVLVVYLAVVVLLIAGMWKIFLKAGQQGWLAIIPILNFYILIKIAGREGWWIILHFIPCINIVVAFIIFIDVAKKFGKTSVYGVAMLFFPFIFIPMLGFGAAEFEGDKTRIL